MEGLTKANTIVDRLRHWLLVLLSPLILGVITNLFVVWGTHQPIRPWLWWTSAGLALLWVVLYVSAFTKVFRRPLEGLAAIRRSRRLSSPNVLILDGSLVHRQPANVPLYYTDRRPDDWQHALTSNNSAWRVETGPVQRIGEDRFDIVLNPFGEAYPKTFGYVLGKPLRRNTRVGDAVDGRWLEGGWPQYRRRACRFHSCCLCHESATSMIFSSGRPYGNGQREEQLSDKALPAPACRQAGMADSRTV